jgi:hypothetical protein
MSTHSWAYQPSHPAYRTAWPTILHDTRRIVAHVRQLGIVIAGPDGHRGPVFDADNGVEFNGDATTDLAGGPFVLLAPLPSHPRGLPTATASCTTNRKPYALAVTGVLLRCALLVPEAFAVASDESWDQWAHGRPSWPTGALRHSPRRVVADLFGDEPLASPLSDSIHPVDFASLTPAAPPPPPVRHFQRDQAVHVHAHGTWRPGTVTKLGRTRLTVRYTRDADGQTDERPFPTTQVHPADGVALVAVDQLQRGDIVVAPGGQDLAVADLRPGRRRYRIVRYTNGSEAEMLAHILMRVRT